MPISPGSEERTMPLGVLQHYTIEPSNLERTKKFYCEVLGLKNGDRPPLGFPGYWLYSGGVPTVHLLGKRTPREGIVVRGTKKKFKDTGRFDHIAFAASDLPGVRKRLESKKVKFREQIVPRTGAAQIFLYDPDGVGAPFGDAGAYERVIGRAKGEVDPRDPANKGIALIDKALLNERGKVEYAADFFILRPKDPAKGNGHILYEVNNRGRKMLFGNIADGPQGVNDPKTLADVGNGFPMRRGYTVVWSGWDPDAPRANMGLGLTAPVATDNGKPIVRTVHDEFVSGTRGGALEAFKLSYEMATQEGARLTVRERQADKPQDVAWTAADARTIRLVD